MGRDEYQFATLALRSGGHIGLLKAAIGGLCLSMAILGWVVQLHPLGPNGTPVRLIHLLASSSALIMAAWWLWGRWPSYVQAVAFVAWADVSLAVAASVLSAPQSRICATIHFGLIGMFAAFLLGKKVLAVHCAFAVTVITALTAYSTFVDQVGWFDLYIYFAPALSTVVVMPVALQAVIDGGRKMARATARDALRDPMTGLYNRRGMYRAAQEFITDQPAGVLTVAVVDLDRFKDLNDTYGHDHGDAVIRAVGTALKACVRSRDVVARVGGDEFVVIAILDSPSGLDGFIERIRDAAATSASAVTVTTSIGIASRSITTDAYNDTALDTVLAHADTAMYDAKRSGGNRIAHYAFDMDARLDDGETPRIRRDERQIHHSTPPTRRRSS